MKFVILILFILHSARINAQSFTIGDDLLIVSRHLNVDSLTFKVFARPKVVAAEPSKTIVIDSINRFGISGQVIFGADELGTTIQWRSYFSNTEAYKAAKDYLQSILGKPIVRPSGALVWGGKDNTFVMLSKEKDDTFSTLVTLLH